MSGKAIGVGGVMVILVLWFALGSTSGGDSESTSDRCLEVPASVVEAIASGLTVGGGGTLRNAAAVRSADFKSFYFISAELDGSGLEGDGEIGTWASNQIEPSHGIILAVNGTAIEFSVFPDGSQTAAELRLGDDGVRESQQCVMRLNRGR